MYKKINNIQQVQREFQNEFQNEVNQKTPQNHLVLAQHKAQFNIESNKNMSLNEMKGLSHNNFITNTNNMREDYQKQHLEKNRNIQINLGFRG